MVENPHPLLAIALLVGLVLINYGITGRRRRGRPSRDAKRSARRWPFASRSQLTLVKPAVDAADQLRIVERTDFRSQRVLRHQEGQVFLAVEAAIARHRLDWRVFAQVSLGEILRCHDRQGFHAINAKRVDVLLVDAGFAPLAAIEYQGGGHHLSPAAARDAVKKEALRKAGVAYFEISPDDDPSDVDRLIKRLAARRVFSDVAGGPYPASGEAA